MYNLSEIHVFYLQTQPSRLPGPPALQTARPACPPSSVIQFFLSNYSFTKLFCQLLEGQCLLTDISKLSVIAITTTKKCTTYFNVTLKVTIKVFHTLSLCYITAKTHLIKKFKKS